MQDILDTAPPGSSRGGKNGGGGVKKKLRARIRGSSGGARHREPPAISAPSDFQHSVHVNSQFEWKGSDPLEQFQIVEQLGEGSFGKVFKLVHRTTHTPLAVKLLDSTHPMMGDLVDDIENEVDILRQCASPHITDYYGSFRTPTSFWLLVEYCDVGSVKDLLELVPKELSEKQCALICVGTVRGLQYLHDECKIIHRDIKPANILLTYKV